MRASDLLSPFFPVSHIPDAEIGKLTQSSKEADSGSVFICIAGANADGHSFAEKAYEAGCRIFVAERSLSLPDDATVLITEDSHRMMGLLASRFYGDPSEEMKIIGITGTKGKTTTAQMLFEMLNQSGIPTGYIGTNGIRYGNVARETSNTTPDGISLQGTLREMATSGIQTVVMEVSSQALKQHRVAGTRFYAGVFTNLSPDHIGKFEHADMEEYRACKARLFSDYGIEHMVVNMDDPASLYMIESACASHIVGFGVENETAEYHCSNMTPIQDVSGLGMEFSVWNSAKSASVHLPMIGRINAANALCAMAISNSLFGISLKNAASTLSSIRIEGRSTQIMTPNGACIVIDYAHNGESLHHILQALKAHTPARLICLFGSVGERSQMRRQELGMAAATYCDLCILTSDNPGCEDPNAIIDEIAIPLAERQVPYIRIPDRGEAIRRGVEGLQNRDILLLAGKGHEDYQLIGKKKIPFCEKEIVLNALSRLSTNYKQDVR